MDDNTRQAARLWTLAQPVVSAFVTSVVSDFAARDDVLQEVAVAVIESFDRYDAERPFVAWAIGIAQHQVGLYLRRVRRDRHVFDDETVTALASTVEEAGLPLRRVDRPAPPDRSRPPKPPMAGAVLYVRGRGQFVLVRKTAEGLPFVTGCNGQTSWAVRPDGPVRFSSDLTRFSRDLPGHEHAMPLSSIEDGLERLREAYDVQLLPIENADNEAGVAAEPSRLLVAVKKSGFRGAKRVEIAYSVRTGLIQQMRFVEMPYGPERLTLRMTLVDERPLGAGFFDHESHHGSDRVVEEE